MGQYRLSVYFEWFIGFGIQFEFMFSKSLSIQIPFIHFYIGLEKEAKGISIFGKEFLIL